MLLVIYKPDTQRIIVRSKRFKESKHFAFSAEFQNQIETAIKGLTELGFNIIARGTFGNDQDILVTDTFKGFKNK